MYQNHQYLRYLTRSKSFVDSYVINECNIIPMTIYEKIVEKAIMATKIFSIRRTYEIYLVFGKIK